MYYTEDGDLREDRALVYSHPVKRKSFIRKIPVVKDMRLRSSKKSYHYQYREDCEDIYAVPNKPSKQSSSSVPPILSCPVCMESYTQDDHTKTCRAPVFLDCHHSICKACLPELMKSTVKPHRNHIGDVTCPQCRMVTQVPHSGLSTNFYIITLLQNPDTSTYTSSRLMMWCDDCQTIAEDCCHDHNVTRLSHVLTKLQETVETQAIKMHAKLEEANHKEDHLAVVLKEAIEGLDKASHALRVRLQNHLELATLKHGTTASLLEQLDSLSVTQPSSMTSSAPPLPPRNSMSVILEDHDPQYSPPNSKKESNLYPDLPNLTMVSNPLSPDSFRRCQSVDSGLGDHKNNNITANRRSTDIARLSSFQQEQRINKLKSNMATLKQIEMSLEEQKSRSITLTANNDNTKEESYLTIDEVKTLFAKAIEAINFSIDSIM